MSSHCICYIKNIHKGHKYFKCDSCGKYLTSASNLRKHIKFIHKVHKDYTCDSCGKLFTGMNFVNDLMCSLRLIADVNNFPHLKYL